MALGSSCLLLFTAVGNGLREFYAKIEESLPGMNQIDFDNQFRRQPDGSWEKITEGKLPEISYSFSLELKKEINIPFLYLSSNLTTENGVKLPFSLNCQLHPVEGTVLIPDDGTVTHKPRTKKKQKLAAERYEETETTLSTRVPKELKINVGWVRDFNLVNPYYKKPALGRMPHPGEMAIVICPKVLAKLNKDWQGLENVKWLGKKVKLHITYLRQNPIESFIPSSVFDIYVAPQNYIGVIDQEVDIVGVTNLPDEISETGFHRDLFDPNHISTYSGLMSSGAMEVLLKNVKSPEMLIDFGAENVSNTALRLSMLRRVEGEDLANNPREMLRQMLADEGLDLSETKITRSVIVVKNPKDLAKFRRIIERKGFKTFSFYDRFKGIKKLGGVIIFTASVLGMVALVISALSITATLLLTVNQRMSEFGILRAVGAQRKHIFLSMLVESAFIGLLAGCLGIILSYSVGLALDYRLNIVLHTTEGLSQFLFDTKSLSIFRYGFSPQLFLLGLVVTVITCVIAALIPSYHAAHIDPIQALRHE